MKQGKGVTMILEKDGNEPRYFSSQLMCPTSGISYNEPAPHSFSFNSPQGACPHCNGLGTINDVDIRKIIPDDTKSIRKGALIPVGPYRNALIFWQIGGHCYQVWFYPGYSGKGDPGRGSSLHPVRFRGTTETAEYPPGSYFQLFPEF